MTQLKLEDYIIPSASFGKDNPLPDIRGAGDLHASIDIDNETVSPEESRYMGWGRVNGILPYTIRDGYNRRKRPKKWKAAILENDNLCAVFLPQLGGRLWSLFDKRAGRELLHKDPVVQPCNLALRNAWLSGGVEWNIGIIGHTPFTVDPLYAETLALGDGTPVLRMYQYERVRRLIYKVEALLPDDSPHLLVRVRIDNAADEDTAVYWWSNIAVDEREDVRVIVPASRAFRFGYGGKLTKVDVPYYEGMDISHTTQIPHALDFFFDIPDGQRRFISAVDCRGYGLVQTSTDALRGRKLFVWGMGKGGRNWQGFLSEPGKAYLEIQAGLARTQLEHLPMERGQSISWTEAYGAVRITEAEAADADWGAAARAVESALEAALPRATLHAWDAQLAAELDGKLGEFIQYGDAWGHVDAMMNIEAFESCGLRFPVPKKGSAEAEWLTLLETGSLPCPDPLAEPKGYQIGEKWMDALKASIDYGMSAHWYGYYQLGVMCAYRNDNTSAEECFNKSIEHAVSPWALRCLAVLKQKAGDAAAAAELMARALDMLPQRHLAIEALQAFIGAGLYEDIERAAQKLHGSIRNLGRIKALRIEAFLQRRMISDAEKLLLSGIELTDVREGEVSLTDMWFRLCALKTAEAEGIEVSDALMERVKSECPPPAALDFRMK